MFWPLVKADPTARQAECRQVCLPPGLAKIAAKHGLLYGDSCGRLGCRASSGGFIKFGILTYRFVCDEEGPEPLKLNATAAAEAQRARAGRSDDE